MPIKTHVIAKRCPAGLESLGSIKCLRVLTTPHCGNQLLCSSANAFYSFAGQWEGDSPCWFGVSASGDGCKLQISLLKCLGLSQGEDIKTVRMCLIHGEAQPGLDLRGRKPSLRLSLLSCSPCLYIPDALGFSLPRAAPHSPSQCAPGSYLCRVFS